MHEPSHSHQAKDNLQLCLSETMKFLLDSDEYIEPPSATELQRSGQRVHSKPVGEKQLFKFKEVTPEFAFSSQSSKVCFSIFLIYLMINIQYMLISYDKILL